MNPPDLRGLTNGDEEYLLIKLSKETKKMWVTYLNGDDPDGEHEFYWGLSVSYLVERDRMSDEQNPPRSSGSSDLRYPSRKNDKGEVMGHERAEQLKKSTRMRWNAHKIPTTSIGIGGRKLRTSCCYNSSRRFVGANVSF
jgi:hypothetical protein